MVSIIRLYFLHQVTVSVDRAHASVYVAYWSTVEMNVALVIACIPTLKPLAAKWCPSCLDSLGSHRRMKRDGGNRGSTSDDVEMTGQSIHPPTISSPRKPVRQRPEDRDIEH